MDLCQLFFFNMRTKMIKSLFFKGLDRLISIKKTIKGREPFDSGKLEKYGEK